MNEDEGVNRKLPIDLNPATIRDPAGKGLYSRNGCNL
jgi:hypothetical protein